MIIKPYDQWRDERIAEAGRKACELLESGADVEPQEIECTDCHGEGGRDCDCGCPNCEGVTDCETCSGSGHIATADPLVLEEVEKDQANRKEYLRQLARDLVALSEWLGRPSLFHVVDAGMAPATLMRQGGARSLILHDPETGAAIEAPDEVPRT